MLVNLTESIWSKIGLNMTETDETYLFEHEQKVTTTNFNLLNLTENNRIWPKIGHVQRFQSYSFSHIDSVMLTTLKYFALSYMDI